MLIIIFDTPKYSERILSIYDPRRPIFQETTPLDNLSMASG
ncbi:MAG: hypothetical protein PHV49_06785 [Alistipes sp.]|nr:hypothetical protein [Alistipes sp.]